MILTTDIETTYVTLDKGKTDPSPFWGENYLVSIGWKERNSDTVYKIANHDKRIGDFDIKEFQGVLSSTTLLIAHNAKFELTWFQALGLEYSGAVWDTMLFEYVAARGTTEAFDLDSCCSRYGISGKTSTLDKYFSQGYNTNQIPADELIEYGINDVEITQQLFEAQLKTIGGKYAYFITS